MTPLRLGEGHICEQATHLGRIVVRDRCLEMLTSRRRLLELAAQPAPEADLGGVHMGGDGIEPPTPCL